MAALKYSRQRVYIKDYLANTTEHPTADMIYSNVKKELPNISLGTVYRNLNLLIETGDIVKISSPDGADRFECNTTPHYHVVCTQCGKISDITLEKDLVQKISQIGDSSFKGEVTHHVTTFYGTCEDCLK